MGKWRWALPLAVAIVASAVVGGGAGGIPTMLDGPFILMTSPLDGAGFCGRAVPGAGLRAGADLRLLLRHPGLRMDLLGHRFLISL
ncbi:hypothetical protein COCNU_scaffold004243G000010 [Cocos nucifera]|nr:hypothetical protein [Cocos nucifera]